MSFKTVFKEAFKGLETTTLKLRGGSQIGFWLSDDYKERYDRLQMMTDKGFGQRVKRLIMEAIDFMDQDERFQSQPETDEPSNP